MAGATLGFLKFVLGFDTISFKKGMSEADRELAKLSSKFKKFGASMADLGKSMSISLTAPLVAFAAMGIKEARETEVALSKVKNALAQTGAVAKQTAPQLKAAADAFEAKSLYEADQILSDVTANLLRFGKILPENFQAAQQAAVDLAAATGKDLSAASIAVGKALQDPVKGMKALKDVGITLTDAQKKVVAQMVATGDAAKIQSTILGLLASKTHDAALAAQNSDPYNQLSDAIKNLGEQFGTALLPYLKATADNLTSVTTAFTNLNGPAKDIIVTLGLMVALTGPVLYLFGNIIKIASGFRVLTLFAAGLTAVSVGEGAAATGAYALGAALNVALGPIALATAAAWALYEAFEAFPKLKDAVTGTIAAIADYIGGPLIDAAKKAHPILGALIAAMGWLASGSGKGAGKVTKAGLLSNIAGSAQDLGAQMLGATGTPSPVIPDLSGGGTGSKKTKTAHTKTVDAAKELANRVKAITDRILPAQAGLAQYEKDLADLTAQYGKTSDGADKLAEAIKALNDERDKALTSDLTDVPMDLPTGFDVYEQGGNAWRDEQAIEHSTEVSMGKIAEINKNKTQEMADAWGSFATSAIESMKGMVDAFKSGDILGGIQKLLDVVLSLVQTLSKVGMIGGGGASATTSGATNGFGGFRARGGPVVPGKTYGVGENGPEWFSPKRRGFIHPTGKEGQAQRLVVVPSPYFDVVVDHRAANVAAPMAGQAAIIGVTGSEVRANRRARRNLLAA